MFNRQLLTILYFVLAILLFSSDATAQNKSANTKIGKNETEFSLFHFQEVIGEYGGEQVFGAQVVYRLAWKKSTKLGFGGMICADPPSETMYPYGALFADIVQFIGKRQKWNFEGQIGHGIYHEERDVDDIYASGHYRRIAGMYYTISIGYRMIVSQKILLLISPGFDYRSYRDSWDLQYYSPPWTLKTTEVEYYVGVGLKVGIVF